MTITADQIGSAVARRATKAAADTAAPTGAAEIEPGTGGRARVMTQITAGDVITSAVPAIEKALPNTLSADRLARAALTAFRTTPGLHGCTSASFLGAMMTCAQLGLEPNGPLGQAWLIPRKRTVRDADGTTHELLECTFQPGYKGLISLFWNSPLAVDLDMRPRYAGDEFRYRRGSDKFLVHIEELDPAARGEVTAYYAVTRLTRGGTQFEVMSAADMIAHRNRYVPKWRSTPWATNHDEMACKTVFTRLFKTLPYSVSRDMDRALANDGAVRNDTDPDAIDAVEHDRDVEAPA